MNTLQFEPLAKKVTFDSNTMWVELADGRHLGVPIAYFPRLLNTSQAQRKKYIISSGGTGLHWYKLDEDILVKYLLFGFVYDGSLISQAFVFYPGLQRQLVTAHRPDADVDVIRVVSFKINPIADLSGER